MVDVDALVQKPRILKIQEREKERMRESLCECARVSIAADVRPSSCAKAPPGM